jgi:hypothetical protein
MQARLKMTNMGEDLIAAIVGNKKIVKANNCPAVPVHMSSAFYCAVQSDFGAGLKIEAGPNMQKQINTVIGFNGANSETAVWHFSLIGPVHHFVVVPWYQHKRPHGQVYSVFMAYENKYTLQQYVHGTGGFVPAIKKMGYKDAWTISQLSTMLSTLLTSNKAWQDYFGKVGITHPATKITCWKYRTITLKSAIANVKIYGK